MLNRRSSRLLVPCLILIGLLAVGCGSPPAPSGNEVDWVRFEGRGVSLDMPNTFTAIDLSPETRANMVERLRDKGGSYAQLAATLERNPNIYRLMLVDAKAPTNINIAGGKAEANPRTALEELTWRLPEEVTVKSLDDMFVGKSSAARMITEWTESNIAQAAYAVKYLDTLFFITYTTQSDKLEEMLPIFEQSIQTFTVEP